MFERDAGLYGAFEDLPIISQKGHFRRAELLARLDIGDVSRKTCVDFGMGSWAFASIYPRLHNCARAIGMDISEQAIRLSEKLVAESRPEYADRFQALQSDGMMLPLPDRSVDLFFSGESIEHVRFPPRFLSEVHRVLADDGQLIITTPNRDAIGYRDQDEEYCTSPEHFWLCNYSELTAMVSEFFDIREAYGFNGSFGPDMDRAIADERRAEEWSRKFESEPSLATGIVLRAVKKNDVSVQYDINDIGSNSISISGADCYLPLEFGLKGLLLDRPDAEVIIARPPSDGVVCRFWSHRWSGHALLEFVDQCDRVDLYTLVPGWKNWICAKPTTGLSQIKVRPTMEKGPKSDNSQVIFFEAFTWHRTGSAESPFVAMQGANRPKAALDLYSAGEGFARLNCFVGTSVFHWFTPSEGNVRGPWKPIGGRPSWTGKADFWKGQIKQMMMANIDAIYLHCINQYEEQRIEFFKAYAQLRREGWDVPKLAPFLDPFYLWRENPIDVATPQGKDEFVRHYVRFFEQYLAENTDPHAESFLLHIEGRIVLTSWWVCHLLQNVEDLSRLDVESRLGAALQERLPTLRNGIYMMTAALIDPDLKFSDERLVMFSGYTYAIHCVHKNMDVWHVQPGYWDQNIRQPGYLLPRDGGKNYRQAWNIVAANVPGVHRVYVESWNEYDEGSGIYAADPAAPFCDSAMHDFSDMFSDRSDAFEYIKTTAEGAARVNGRSADDARIIHHVAPKSVPAGDRSEVAIIMRNQGNARWRGSDGVGLAVLCDGRVERVVPLDDNRDEIQLYDGIFRGRPTMFLVPFDAPRDRRLITLSLSMIRGQTLFGERIEVSIPVC